MRPNPNLLFKYEGACRFFRYLTVPTSYSQHTYETISTLDVSLSSNQAPSARSHNRRQSDSAISNATLAWPWLMCAGGFAGAVSWLSTFPFDVIKTRVQSIDYPRGIENFVHKSSDGVLKGVGSRPQTFSSLRPGEPTSLRQGFYSNPSAPNSSKIRHPYQTTLSTIVQSYRTEGYRVFFHGLSPTLIRSV